MDQKEASEESRVASIKYAQMELKEEPLWSNEQLMYEREASEAFLVLKSWYYDIHFNLVRGSCPEHLYASQWRVLRLKFNLYHLANSIIYRRNHDVIWLRCLEKDDANHVAREMHDDPASGHYGKETTAHKILRDEYYWPTVFKDSHAYACKFKACQTTAGWERKPMLWFIDHSSNEA